MEPSEDMISTVIGITELDPVGDRDLVKLALQSNDLNVEAVINQYYEDANAFTSKYDTWKERDFHGDRDGVDNNAGISFHIESSDQNGIIQGVTPPPGFGAPSRPPSRTSNRSPMGGVVNWITDEATGVPNSRAQEDEAMAKALQESKQEAEAAGYVLPQQESGVTFGPANRTDYETGQWAMVPVGAGGQMTQLETTPPALARMKNADAPAFLVMGSQRGEPHRLGGLLTILHEIPLARNILLGAGEPPASYGYNNEWWKGQEILPPPVLAKLQSGELEWGSQEAQPVFAEELHRLMAFLDQTHRSYGTVSSLTDLLPFPGFGVEKQLYERLSGSEESNGLMHSVALSPVLDDLSGDETTDFGLLEIELNTDDFTGINTLYEAIDCVMWGDSFVSGEVQPDTRMAVLLRMGEVFAVKFTGTGPRAEQGLEVPMELYPERWLAERKSEARSIQMGMTRNRREQQNAVKGNYHTLWQDIDAPGETAERGSIVDKMTEQWGAYHEYLRTAGQYRAMASSGFDPNRFPDYRAAPTELGEEEREAMHKVEEAMEWTTQVADKLQERRKAWADYSVGLSAENHLMGKLLTDPIKDRPKPMTGSKFSLRGVATAADTIYVCRRSEPDLIDLGEKPEPKDQWWRLRYGMGDEVPVQAERVEAELLMRNMWRESRTPVLVYATDAALSAEKAPLSKALEQFVRADNKAFRQEIHAYEQGMKDITDGPRREVTPLSPSKRKHRPDSPDSMDSNRASIGSQDPFDSNTNEPADMMDLGDVSQDMMGVGDGDAVAEIHPSTLTDINDVPEKVELATEMEERARPPPFLAARTASAEKQSFGMDMDIPDGGERNN